MSAPLDHDVAMAGQMSANLFASTSGTDADFIVKLIDVYPESAQANAWNADGGAAARGSTPSRSMGTNCRSRWRCAAAGTSRATSTRSHSCAGTPIEWDVPLRDHDHVFLKGHRIMVQVQSTWFPMIDRNPQKFVPSIYKATASDFVKATQRIYSTPKMPSHIVLPIMPEGLLSGQM